MPEQNNDLERRYIFGELRAVKKDKEPARIVGYAARYNQLSDVLGNFREQIAPGFFDGIEGDDVRALFNHDPNYVLGRSTNGTLKLSTDENGLAVDITPPDAQWARDLMVSIERGDVSQMSFAFTIAENGDKWEKVEGNWIRTLVRKGRVFDVSPVTYPAYPQTSAAVRSKLETLQQDETNPTDQAAPGGAEVSAKARQAARRRLLDLLDV
jgi:HK97 family phage prohead protease